MNDDLSDNVGFEKFRNCEGYSRIEIEMNGWIKIGLDGLILGE
jgi:hypothetical protein